MSLHFLEGRCFDTRWRRGPVRTFPADVADILAGIDAVLAEEARYGR